MRTFLLADSAAHADIFDKLVLASLADRGIYGGAWSEVYTDGERYGIFWGSPVSELLGFPPSEDHPDGDPSMVLVTESEELPWTVLIPEPEPADDIY